jgi:hypothetical protein
MKSFAELMKRQRCKICKRGYGYWGDLGCIHIWAAIDWEETQKLLEEYDPNEIKTDNVPVKSEKDG